MHKPRSAPRSAPVVVSMALALAGCANAPSSEPPAGKTVHDVIPLTMGNLRGHKALYDEGWFVVTSSKRALAFAKEHAVVASRDAIAEAAKRTGRRSSELPGELKDDLKSGVDTAVDVAKFGTAQSGRIFRGTHRLAQKELAYAKENFEKAADRFVQGNLALVRRTQGDRERLGALPGRLLDKVSEDFSNIGELAESANQQFAGKIEAGWDKAFADAREAFRQEYERSAEKQNTLLALGPILSGYAKSFYHGLIAPTSRSVAKGGSALVTHGVFRPTATAMMVAGRTVETLGLSLYYTADAGVKIVSPTVEAGMLSGLSLLSLSAVPATYVTGGTVGTLNQVAFTAGAPVAGAAQATATAAVDAAAYAGFVAFDAVAGTTKVVINQAQAGVVLGYNALTAIPSHLLLGVSDAAIFLAWEGPRLVIAVASGELAAGDSEGTAASVGDLPVGSVADLDRLRRIQGVKVETLSSDPQVIEQVIRQLPCDLRTGGEARCDR